MYYDTCVDIPFEKGKITIKSNKYVMLETERIYDSSKKYNVPSRVTIGVTSDNKTMMINDNYLKYFDTSSLPTEAEFERSSCLRIGAYCILDKIIKEYELDKLCGSIFQEEGFLILDLVSYYIISECGVSQYYPDYAYNHPLFSKDMKIYSDSKVSSLLKSIDDNQRITFLNAWVNLRKKDERIYISYDSTNKNCQALDTELAEIGHAKDDESKPIINIAIGYNLDNKEPLFYEEYPGSIVDVSQLDFMIEKANSYGYKDIGFILDRGYFSKGNIKHLDNLGYSFIIAAKGSKKFINKYVKEVKGSFESLHKNRINKFEVYGTTIERTLFNTNRYIHIYFNELKAAIEKENIENKIGYYESILLKGIGSKKDYSSFASYFDLYYDKEGIFSGYTPKNKVIEEEKKYCGYFVIVTSVKMTYEKALILYKSRDTSEKLFKSDKSFLGGNAFYVQSTASIRSKTLLQFIALIIRNRIHVCLQENKDILDKSNIYTVPNSIRELEKIEMIKGLDGKYRLDHAISATQKKILKCFNISQNNILDKAESIKKQLEKAAKSQ